MYFNVNTRFFMSRTDFRYSTVQNQDVLYDSSAVHTTTSLDVEPRTFISRDKHLIPRIIGIFTTKHNNIKTDPMKILLTIPKAHCL